MNRDHGADPDFAFDVERPAVHLDQVVDQAQTQARALQAPDQRILDLPERFHDLGDLLCRDAAAIVGDLQPDASLSLQPTLTLTSPPSGVNFIALDSRFNMICLQTRGSA